MEHLALEVFNRSGGSSQFLNLPDNTTITITETSEIFGSGDVWSLSFTLNVNANMHIFGTSGEIHGSRLHEQIDNLLVRLWAEGLPLCLGRLYLNDEVDVDAGGNVEVTFENRQKPFDEKIKEMNARDVPMLGEHLIGVAAWRDRYPKIKVEYGIARNGNQENFWWEQSFDIAAIEGGLASRWPKRVVHSGNFSKADGTPYTVAHANTINTDNPYDDNAPLSHPYCNVNVGYQKKDSENNPVRGYTIHEVAYKTSAGNPNLSAWPNSAPCFFVMYWLRALLTHLGIHIEENQMQGVADLRRLFMMNTLCAYEEPDAAPTAEGTGKEMLLTGLDYGNPSTGNSYETTYDTTESSAVITSVEITPAGSASPHTGETDDFTVFVHSVRETNPETIIAHPAFASSDCFPDVPAADIIAALHDAFGVRLLFSDDYTKVRIVMLRNIFRSQEVQTIHADVLSLYKTESNLRGFMMTYNGEGTAFGLPLFDNKLDKEHKAGKADTTGKDYTLTPIDYGAAVRAVSGLNKHLYYTPQGNTYAYKIDEEAKRYRDYRPSLFEVAGFMDAVDGDCTGEKATFETISLAFTPLIVSDANNRESQPENRRSSSGQRFFAYIGEEMNGTSFRPADGTDGGSTEVNGDIVCGKVNINHSYSDETVHLEAELFVYENRKYHFYDNYPQNDEGVAPIETHDWGLTLGVMRGSGSDAYVRYTPDPDDLEGNDTWEVSPGSSATAHPDTCNDYGEEWDYNGTGSGIGPREGRFSLKIRAEKPNPDFDDTQPESENNARYLPIENGNLRGRGLADQFYKEYSKFIREARVAIMQVNLGIAELIGIDKTKRVRIGDIMGFVRKMKYEISIADGLGPVTLEILYI